MFEEEEWLALVATLIAATKSNSVKWIEKGNAVVTVVGNTSYEVGSVDGDDRIPFYLRVLLNEERKQTEIARIESEPVSSNMDWTAAERLLELRNVAFRSAKGAPQIFSKLLSELKATTDPPF